MMSQYTFVRIAECFLITLRTMTHAGFSETFHYDLCPLVHSLRQKENLDDDFLNDLNHHPMKSQIMKF